MGWQNDEKKKAQKAIDEADVVWFAERMAALVAELKTVKSARQLAFVRSCVTEAMAAHARVSAGSVTSGDDY